MKITKSAIRRSDAKTLFTIVLDTDEIRKLDDNDLSELIWEAAVNITCRSFKGDETKSDKSKQLLGRTLDTAAVIELLKATSTRGNGEPSQKDVKDASAKHAALWAEAVLTHPDTKDASHVEEEQVKAARKAHVKEQINAWIRRVNDKCPGLSFESDSSDTNATTLAKMYRAHRLWTARQAPSLPE